MCQIDENVQEPIGSLVVNYRESLEIFEGLSLGIVQNTRDPKGRRRERERNFLKVKKMYHESSGRSLN